MSKEVHNSQLSELDQYWKNLHIKGTDRTTLRHDMTTGDSYQKQTVSLPIDHQLMKRMMSITKNNDMLTYVTFLMGLLIELYKYTGSDEILVGVPVYYSREKRPQNIKNKLMPFKRSLNGGYKIKNFLVETQRGLLDHYDNQFVNLEQVFRQLGVSESISTLVPISITYNKLHAKEDIHFICESIHNELTLCIEKDDQNYFEAKLIYNAALFKRETVESFGMNYFQVLSDLLDKLDMTIKDIDMITEKQIKLVVEEFNNTEVQFKNANLTLPELFQKQVEQTPEQIAVIFEGREVTFRKLNKMANSLAHSLMKQQVKNNHVVGIILDRSIEMVAGILGVLKSGAAYLPIDPNNPKDRIEYILTDAKVDLVITKPSLITEVDFNGKVIDVSKKQVFTEETTNPDVTNLLNDLAYVIYTSGTTGNPKGVMVEHHSLTQTMLWEKKEYDYNHENVVLPLVNYAFDGFIIAFFTPLIAGGQVVLVNNEEMSNPFKISELIRSYKITDYLSVPSIYLSVLDFISSKDAIYLKQVTLVGEEMPVNAIDYTNKLHFGIEIINRYGPSENTVDTTIMRNVENSEKILIGKPIANSKVYILDKDHKLLPIGVPGEICIGGSRLARGYVKRPELTKERFIDNPFDPGKRMYKTGDMAAWMPDGSIQFLGREDDQVKVRGIRIELKEIEHKLLQHVQIKEAVVLVEKKDNQDQYLSAYIVGLNIHVPEIRSFLRDKLPQYMVPTYITPIEKIPLTNNGKINRNALAKRSSEANMESIYVAPRDGMEATLTKIWCEVLGINQVGIDDNFFELGGHSLKANVLISKIHQELNMEITFKEVFLHPTIREIRRLMEDVKQEQRYEMIPVCEEREYYETSSAQKRMYMVEQLEKGTAYNMPMVLEVEGPLHLERVCQAFEKLIARHDSLRTHFEEVNGEIVQKIASHVAFEMETNRPTGETIEDIVQNFVRPFQLQEAPLFRAKLVETKKKRYLLVDMHHIISDGVSIQLLMTEFMELYQGNDLEPLRIQYKDFAHWQNRQLMLDTVKQQEAYWLHQFAGEIPVLNLPYDMKRPLVQSFEGDRVPLFIDEELTHALRKLANETGSTMHMVLLSAYYLLLSKYSGQEDIVIGTPVAGRSHADLQSIIGMFVNTLALRNRVDGNKRYVDFLKAVKENVLLAYENQSYQFEELIERLHINRDASRNPLFDVMFNMNPVDDTIVFPLEDDFQLKQVQHESNIAKFDVTLHVTEYTNTIQGSLEYSTALFTSETMERMARHYLEIVKGICQQREAKLAELDMMTEEEKQQIIMQFNDTKTDYPREKTMAELFEEQVAKKPNELAVGFENQCMTYQELNEKANQLARVLRQKGVQAETVVGLMTDNTIEMIIGILGILKSGGAYLPLDKTYPMKRIEYMLKDSNAQLVLTENDAEKLGAFSGERLDITNESLYVGNTSNLSIEHHPTNLAYIMYSSGSTGEPKGILIEQRNVVRLVKHTSYIQFNEGDRILHTGSLVFDASTFEIWGSLLNGQSLYLTKKETILSVEKLENAIEKHSITLMWLTVALFNQLAQEKPDMFRHLRCLLVGGDVLSTKHIQLVRSHCPNIQIINGYGPTENTTFSTTLPIEKDYESSIPIGRPISNSSAYIVGKHGELNPIGVYGELWLSGDGVARGYLNRPALTKEKFIENPFVRGERLYKSGDIARWLPDGTIEFLGRVDHQLKIRGFRIEIEEIERKLLRHHAVKEAVVLVKENEQLDKYLIAYLTAHKLEKSNLKEYLQDSLPDYMIPSYIKEVSTIPLTANGKVDRRSLPEVTNQDLIQGEYKAPENKEEEKLVKIWQEVLGINEIGTEDNFFELGGNSLKASLVMNKVHKELGKDLPLKIFFEHATIRSIARYIRRSGNKVYEQIEKVDMKEYYQTSSVQKRMYTLQQFEKDSIAYNMPAVYELDGTINKERLNKTFKKLFNRHESLRTSFQMIDGEVVQKINDDIAFNLNFIKKSNIYLETIINDLIQPFDLEEAPLFRGMLLENGEKSYLFIDLHHIIADGISMNILIKDFIRLYNGSNLSPLQIQYKDFAEWHNKILKSNEIKQQENYWKGQFRGHLPVLNLPYDFERPQVKSFEGNQISFSLDKQRMNILKKISNQSDSTLFMVILSSFYILLAKYSEQEDIIVGTTTAGRLHANLEDVMGMFVNTIALRNRPEREKAFKDFLMEVKANSVAAFENQTYQFEALLESENIEKDISRNPLFDVMFSMNNQETDAIENLMLDGFVMEPLKINAGITKFDLSLAVTEREAGLTCSFEYCTKLFKQETIEKMINHFKEIVKCICENPNMKISDMEMISPAEKEKILTDVNNTKTNYPKNKSYVMLLEKKITENANGIAAVYKDKQITYGELNQKANALAQVLRNEGIQDNSIIPIMVDRSIEMLIGILGILKAGAAFMPIDTKFPKERINYMLEDIKASLFLTVKGSDIPTSVNPIYLDDERVYCNVDLDFQVAYSPDKLAYVMYTSGSTGKPKGVQITQRSIVNLCMWFGKQYGLYQNKNVLQNTSISFDVSVEEIFPTLLYGGTLFITTEKESLSREHFRDFIRRNKINIVQLVPTMMREFIAGGEKLESIQVLISGGEALPQALQAEIMDIGYNLYNCYGPTEYTVDAITTKCVESENVVIGKPIANTNAYILDRDGHLQPIGLPGELCIGGDGLALGYLNRPELTSEKFVENPFIQGEKIYKTGDRAKLLSDGTIEFLGRIDNQVKIRGVRVELGEIEERIQEHPEVKEAVVIAKVNHHDHYLVAYIIGSIASLEIKQYLKKTLPYNMVPTHIMKLEELPLTNNGKVNRNALPEPNLEMMSQVERAQPKTKLQKNLMDIWSNVLNKEIYSIYVNFFEIGGHSLKAIIVSNEIEKNINVAVSIIDIFKYPSIQELSDFLEGKQEKRYEMIPVCEEREYYETSSAQKRMYMVEQLEKGTAYNMPMVLEVEGPLHLERVCQSFEKLIARHDSLRTHFEEVNGEIVQKITSHVAFEMETNRPTGETIEDIVQNFVRPFQLQEAPLFRAKLVETKKKRYLLVDMHHIISDGVSIQLLMTEFMELYQGNDLEPLRIQYKDFAHWQNRQLMLDTVKQQEAYWLHQFAGEIPVLNLPYDMKRPLVQSFEGDRVPLFIDEELTHALRKLANETGSTMHMVLLSAYYLLLSKYSGQEDIVIGTPVAGRSHADLQSIIGMFVNTLALRNRVDGNKRYVDFLKAVKENVLLAYENQSYQFEELIERLHINRDASRNPLFDVMFNMNPVDDTIVFPLEDDFQLKQVQHESNIAKFDVTLHVTEYTNTIQGSLEYSTALFTSETMERMARHYLEIVKGICQQREAKLAELDMMTEEEKQQIIMQFNDTKTDYPREKTMAELFEEQVAKKPNELAVGFENQCMTYQELNEKANQLARVLRQKGVQAETVVGLMTDNTIEMIIGILGILKSGGAYLPLDKTYPMKRIEYMLKDSNAQLVLTENDAEKLGAFSGERLDITNESLYVGNTSNLSIEHHPTNLAYIMYSSGSTGEPKGILIEQRNVVRLVKHTSYIQFNEGDRILQTGSLVFDASTFEIWGSLLNGQSLYLTKKETILSVEKLENAIEKHSITLMWLTVALFNQLAQEKPDMFRHLRCLLVGGDVLSTKHIQLVRSHCSNIQIINGYGPTENTTFSTTLPIEKDYESSIPIGRPISNSSAYIVGKHGELNPIGVYGELWLSGDGVARGYLNRPALTKEKFIENPFVRGERLYKSGDIARWLPDGTIEFLGRVDHQLKIRGFRIEIEEIERKLLRHHAVKEAVVLVKENEQLDKYLIAYLTAHKLEKSNLKEYLQDSLPDYMIPSYIKEVSSIPLTANGKVDRRSLPEVTNQDLIQGEYKAPENKEEEKLVKIWQEVLGINEIGTEDNFFELGGNSISFVQLLSKIREYFKAGIGLDSLYTNATIKSMAKLIRNEESSFIVGEEDLHLLNGKKDHNIFAFPPIGGFGMVYNGMANLMDTHSLYAFDFINSDNRIDQYIELIRMVQPEPPYQLLGYSAGGNLAFEITAEMERQGLEVSYIILLDSYPIEGATLNKADTTNLYDNIIKEAKTNPAYQKYLERDYFKEEIIKKIKLYSDYVNNLINHHIIDTTIHFIQAQNDEHYVKDELSLPKWDEFTKKDVLNYQGYGNHGDMLSEPYLERNMEVINQILTSLQMKALNTK